MEIVCILLIAALAAAFAVVLSLWRKLAAERTARAVSNERARNAETRLATAEKDFEHRIADMRTALSDKFKVMADEALQQSTQRNEQRQKQSLEAMLTPMRQAFEKLSATFEQHNADDTAQRAVLGNAIETLRALNNQVSDETRRLTSALKGNTRFQGRWGEMVLENILESSGLEKSRWVVYQETTTDDGQRLRPDAVIHCPRNRDIIIDSKVSLTAYLRMLDSDDEAQRKQLIDEHLRSIETHLRSLGNKEYQKHVGAADAGFVLMFVPHEGAYLAAMQRDPDLWQRAYDRRVVIVSPTHLITVVRLVEQMWQSADQTANSMKIAEEASKMLDQLNEFLSDLADVGKALDKAHAAHEKATARLSTGRGNVLRRAARLRDLGVKTSKALPLPDDDLPDAPDPAS